MVMVCSVLTQAGSSGLALADAVVRCCPFCVGVPVETQVFPGGEGISISF